MSDLILSYQDEVVDNVKNGYVGNLPGEPVWTLSSAMMFCLTIFTTIGKIIFEGTDSPICLKAILFFNLSLQAMAI